MVLVVSFKAQEQAYVIMYKYKDMHIYIHMVIPRISIYICGAKERKSEREI